MKRAISVFLVIILITTAIPVHADRDTSSINLEHFADTGFITDYWLYTPANAKPGMKLIVYLHGGTGVGDEPTTLIQNEGFPKFLNEGRLGELNAYVIIPQMRRQFVPESNCISVIKALIDSVVSEYGIDEAGIALTGHSMGGRASWCVAAEFPGFFRRLAPLSGSVTVSSENAGLFSELPIRAYVGSEDFESILSSNISFFEMLSPINPDAILTVIEGATHMEVVNAYLDTDVVAWLIGDDPTSLLIGDANEDGNVDSIDALLILRFALALVDPSSLNLANADVNGDGDVDSVDALTVLRMTMGLI